MSNFVWKPNIQLRCRRWLDIDMHFIANFLQNVPVIKKNGKIGQYLAKLTTTTA